MTANADLRLAPHQRLSRGLKYTAVGPVDITRGVVGLGLNSAQATANGLRRRYESGKLRRQLAAAAEAVAALPEVIQEATAPPKKRRRPLVIAGVAAAVLAGGAVVFSIVRRSTRPEPSPLPPSVEVTPKP
ncbi:MULTISPECIES: cell wall synthesis protein CwsA [Mycolicibacterium]|uniref:Cell wall synthesis protein CwsA n=1 Tax=Mycolicibacterium wolinskyi TaxID=59750 RepID=A0A1X2FFQ1_9MYCO|nr:MULTISPECIES: cell wall synthesis protein CwsA [Mycolicibacterium]MCV7283752.1 cell wall synthesis protein CwsA [Mycolicibacterium wolinskyi]MCV7290913.1 cell wall synthesis protein CwsA [Mycolicibacterium goodii]ORX17266.1 cell wall synthesis protein CwsA [Mycolicibacterium wolinskyi]